MDHHKAVLGLSGGVDSAVAAHRLLKSGYEVVAISMRTNNLRSQQIDIENAAKISKILGIKHKIVDKRKEFDNIVLERFVKDYKNGRTPNPCAICNRYIKFQMLYDEMIKENADTISTGHYANVVKLNNDRYAISESENKKKDQSYLLYNLTQEQLSHIYFPIAGSDKEDIRQIAKEIDVDTSEKKDSFDLCFINDIDYIEFIKRREMGDDYRHKIATGLIKEEDYFAKAKFVDKEGNFLGTNDGIINYTIGQRKGLGTAFGKRTYVVDIDKNKNEVVLGDDKDLYNDEFKVSEVNYQAIDDFEENNTYEYLAKVRYRHEKTMCSITRVGDVLYCKLKEKARAITKGQSAVFYDNDGIIIAGGTIM